MKSHPYTGEPTYPRYYRVLDDACTLIRRWVVVVDGREVAVCTNQKAADAANRLHGDAGRVCCDFGGICQDCGGAAQDRYDRKCVPCWRRTAARWSKWATPSRIPMHIASNGESDMMSLAYFPLRRRGAA